MTAVERPILAWRWIEWTQLFSFVHGFRSQMKDDRMLKLIHENRRTFMIELGLLDSLILHVKKKHFFHSHVTTIRYPLYATLLEGISGRFWMLAAAGGTTTLANGCFRFCWQFREAYTGVWIVDIPVQYT